MLATVREEKGVAAILNEVYSALISTGYSPIDQLVGYLITEDPTYISAAGNARSMITHIDRDDALRFMLQSYLGVK